MCKDWQKTGAVDCFYHYWRTKKKQQPLSYVVCFYHFASGFMSHLLSATRVCGIISRCACGLTCVSVVMMLDAAETRTSLSASQ